MVFIRRWALIVLIVGIRTDELVARNLKEWSTRRASDALLSDA